MYCDLCNKSGEIWRIRKKTVGRNDGTLLKNMTTMLCVMPTMYPNRFDNEAFIRKKP